MPSGVHRRPRGFGAAALLILLAAFAFRVWTLASSSLWIDEIWTDYQTHTSLDVSFRLMLESGSQTPLYFAAVHYFPSDNDLLLRWPAALMGVLGVALLMRVVMQLYGDGQMALIAGALVAANPYHIWLSRTARPYPQMFILALLASYFFLELLQGHRTRANWIGFTLASMAAYVTHYFTLALPLAQYALFAFILRGNRGFFRNWIKAQVVAGIPLLLWVIAFSRQDVVTLGIGWIPRPGVDDLPITLWNMLVGYDGALPWYLVPGLLSACAGLALGLGCAVAGRKTDRRDFYWFWLATAPLVAVCAVSQFRPVYVDRYFMAALPAVLILTVRGWYRLPRRAWTWTAFALVIASSAVSAAVILHSGDNQKEDWHSAAQYVAQHMQPGDGLLAESPIEWLAVRRYLGPAGDVPESWLLDAPDPENLFGEPVTRVWAFVRNPREDGHRQSVLDDFDPFAPSVSPMPDWLQPRRDQVVEEQAFKGVTVVLLDVPPGAAE